MNHKEYESELKAYIAQHNIDAEHMTFWQSCHSVAQAAQAAQANIDDFVKNICMMGPNDQLIVAIVKGQDRASTSRVAKALQIERPRTATPEEILAKTGYVCGGTPSFGFYAIFLVDPKVMDLPYLFTGGGSENSLVKITPEELVRANNAQIVRMRK